MVLSQCRANCSAQSFKGIVDYHNYPLYKVKKVHSQTISMGRSSPKPLRCLTGKRPWVISSCYANKLNHWTSLVQRLTLCNTWRYIWVIVFWRLKWGLRCILQFYCSKFILWSTFYKLSTLAAKNDGEFDYAGSILNLILEDDPNAAETSFNYAYPSAWQLKYLSLSDQNHINTSFSSNFVCPVSNEIQTIGVAIKEAQKEEKWRFFTLFLFY